METICFRWHIGDIRYREAYNTIWNILYNYKTGVNNMYDFSVPYAETWSCPMCNITGRRINKIFGLCDACGCISMEKQGHDTESLNIRKPFTLQINKEKSGNRTTKIFYTDGSGSRGQIMNTGWAAVEVEKVQGENKDGVTYKVNNIMTELSPIFSSVHKGAPKPSDPTPIISK